MRFHPLAVSVAVGALASSTNVDAFVIPNSSTSSQTATAKSRLASAWMAGNDNQYVNLEENLFKPNSKVNDATSANTKDATTIESSSMAPIENEKPKKPKNVNKRAEKIRAQLEADLAAAEESRTRTAKQLADAEANRLALEAEAGKAAKEAEALEAKFNAFQAKEAARAAGGGGLSAASIVGEIAGPLVGGFATFGGLAIARDSLASRSKKAEEERLEREEAERQAEKAAKRQAAQEAQSKNTLPIVSGLAGLGAFGAFLGSGSFGGGGQVDGSVDASSKQQPNISKGNDVESVTTAVPDPYANVELPYLEKEIAKAETKNKPKLSRPKSKKQLAREAAEEQRATEARLEQKLAEAPELARKAAEAEAKAVAEAQAAEQAKIEAEKKAAEERSLAEAQAAEQARIEAERMAAEAKAAEQARIEADKKAAEAKAVEEARIQAERKAADLKAAEEAKIKAERERALAEKRALDAKLAAEKKAAEEMAAAEEKAKAEKIAADKLAFEKMQAEAAEKAKAEKLAADKLAFEKMRVEEEAKAQAKIKAEQAAALELLKQQEEESKGFLPKVPAVAEMLFGNLKPSQITDKGLSMLFTPNTLVVGGVALAGVAVTAAVVAAGESPEVKSTFKVTGKTPKEFLESKGPAGSQAPSPKKTIRIPKSKEPENQPSVRKTQISPVAGSKEALREQLAKQRDNINRQASEKLAKASTDGQNPTPPSSLPNTDSLSTIESTLENVENTEPAFVPSSTKKSYSPFGGGKPKAVGNDSLYAPPVTETSSVDTNLVKPTSSPEAQGFDSASTAAVPKKSYSPFGGGKPKAVGNDSLYAPPVTETSAVDTPLVEPTPPIVEQSFSDNASVAAVSKKSYSPFGGGKPKAVGDDSLYAPPVTETSAVDTPRVKPTPPIAEQSFSDNASVAAVPKKSYSPFGGGKPKAVGDDSLYAPPAPQASAINSSRRTPVVEPTPPIAEQSFTGDAPPATLPKKSYSPFGGGKPKAVGNDSLYSPPQGTFSSFEETEQFSTNNSNAQSSDSFFQDEQISDIPEESPLTYNVSPPAPKSYSPFGGTKPMAAMSDPLYRPTADQLNEQTITSPNPSSSPPSNYSPFGEVESFDSSDNSLYAPPSDDSSSTTLDVEETSSIPETNTSDAPPAKKSFSPFGWKPQAPSDAGGNSGGYLDGL